MTGKERLEVALSNYSFEQDGINEMLAYAYYCGKCKGVIEVCDMAKIIFKGQIKRADSCRYHKLANWVQGDRTEIYHSDYDNWISLFDSDITDIQ